MSGNKAHTGTEEAFFRSFHVFIGYSKEMTYFYDYIKTF